MQLAIAREVARLDPAMVAVSYDRQSEVTTGLAALQIPRLTVGPTRLGRSLRLVARGAAQPLDVWRIARFCRAHGIDVVFEVMGHPLQDWPRRRLRRHGVRVLTSVHDVNRHAGERNPLLAALARRSMTDTDGIVVYSQAALHELGARSAPVFSTVLGALGTTVARPRSLSERPAVIGFFGRIRTYKGVPRLLAAVAELHRRGYPVRPHIVGHGRLDATDVETVESLGGRIENRWVPESEVEGLIGSFDILALPYDEASQSGVLGFALRTGVPVVATPVGGLAEQVRASGGLLAVGMEPGDFADAIETLLVTSGLYAEVSRAQIIAAQTDFAWARVAADVLDACRAIASRAGSGATSGEA
jgi:glycosyltransferase involved in cell wall biosynthesis